MKFFASVLAACLTLSACQDVNPAAPTRHISSDIVAGVAVSLIVNPPRDTLALGDSVGLKGTLRDATGTIVTGVVQWRVTDTTIATINSSGIVRARRPGVASAIGTSGALADSTPLIVMAPSGLTPELPRTRVAIGMPVVTRILSVSAGGNLQAAVDSARGGDAIELPAGATFYGPISLPVHPGTGYVVIRSSTSAADLPAPGVRVTPAYAARMPKIVATNLSDRALRTLPNAANWRIVGIELTVSAGLATAGTIVELGDGNSTQTTRAMAGRNFILDRVYVHGLPSTDTRRCVSLQSGVAAVVNSWLSECHGRGADTQAIAGWNGPGPYRIENNYLEGAGETVIFGGADPSISGLTPSDIEIRGNEFYKPLSWKGVWLVKNLLEFKNAQRVLIEGNVFDGSWLDGQTGYALNWKSENQSGAAPWSVCQDITFRYNIVRNAGAGLSMTGQLGSNSVTIRARRVLLENNVFTAIATPNYPGDGRIFSVTNGTTQVAWRHNTLVTSGAINSAIAYDNPPASSGLVFTNNIVTRGDYGVKGSGIAEGTSSLNTFSPGWNWGGNVLLGLTTATYPSGTAIVADANAVGFSNYAAGDFRLSATSPFVNKGTDGTNPGADVAGLNAMTAKTVVR